MNYFLRILFSIFFVILLVNILPMMFNFLDIKFSSYSLYMFWIIALVILSIFLPLIYIYAIKLYKFNINFYIHYSIITLLFLIPLFIFIELYNNPVEKTKTEKNC